MKIIGVLLLGVAVYAFVSMRSEQQQVSDELAEAAKQRRASGGQPNVTHSKPPKERAREI